MASPSEHEHARDETVWAWDGGTWWRVVDGAMYRVRRGDGPARKPTAREIGIGTVQARYAIAAAEDVLVQHHERDGLRRRLVGHLGGEVLINEALFDPTADRRTLGQGYIIGWRMGGACALVMGLVDSGEEVGGAR